MQAIGLCRFSYPALGGFQVKHNSIENRIAYLYADARLEERFRLFETIALPCLRAQSDPDFGLIIVIGDQFPPHHKNRLEALVEDMPQVIIHQEPPRRQREVMKEILNDARRDPDEPCLQFRFDDDDAVAVDFIEKLRKAATQAMPFLWGNRSVAIDWNRGYVAECGPGGIKAAEVYRPFNVAALGMLIKGDCQTTIMNFAHEKLPQYMPALSLPQKAMFVRSHHGSNDSRQGVFKSVEVAPLTSKEETLFRDRFAIDVDHVRHVFSGS